MKFIPYSVSLIQTQRVLPRLLLTTNALHTTLDALSSALGGIPKSFCRARHSLSDSTRGASHSVAQAANCITQCVRYASDSFANSIAEATEKSAT